MKFFNLCLLLVALVAMFLGTTQADPKVNLNGVKKAGKAIGKGVGIVSAVGTAKELYDQRKQG